ncbi:hypothetical protein VTK56DRAFT_121 [Thermocarpiscus australiensis]
MKRIRLCCESSFARQETLTHIFSLQASEEPPLRPHQPHPGDWHGPIHAKYPNRSLKAITVDTAVSLMYHTILLQSLARGPFIDESSTRSFGLVAPFLDPLAPYTPPATVIPLAPDQCHHLHSK